MRNSENWIICRTNISLQNFAECFITKEAAYRDGGLHFRFSAVVQSPAEMLDDRRSALIAK